MSLASLALPNEPGFYWAQWRIAEDGTRDGEELTPCTNWEVVEVHTNHSDPDDPEHLRVSVCGVETSQSLENFVWGSGPLVHNGERP